MKVIQGGNQLSLIRDTEEVLKFLEFVGKKSILDEHAIHCRLTACNNLFSVVNEDEDSLDFLLDNLDLLVNRFRNKSKSTNEATLKVYKSRLKSCLEDYKAWSTDPFAWERALTEKKMSANSAQRRVKRVAKAKQPETIKSGRQKTAEKMEPVEATPSEDLSVRSVAGTRRVSFPIRSDFNVEVLLPEDGLTLKELNRLGMFLYPYCQDMDAIEGIWASLPQQH